MRRKLGKTAGLAALALVLGAALAGADEPLSPAQVALFESDHLKKIAWPVVLDYSFQHRGGAAGDYQDEVAADIRDVHPDGTKDVWIEIGSGDHRVDLPPAKGFNGNPLLMFFLEHDVKAMQEETGGSGQYFRTVISDAFAHHAELHPIKVTVDGKALEATDIEVAPFRDDPHLAQFPAFAGKTYQFILSDAVPGSVYHISTTLAAPGAAPDAFEERLTYVGEHEGAH